MTSLTGPLVIVLTKTKEKTYGAIAIAEADTFQSPFPETEFPCLLWDHEGRFNCLERSKVAQALLDAGCRYVVCGGANCENWHDSVDEEFIHRHLEDFEEACEAEHVMTTWHTGEAADDVGFFFVMNTNFDDHDFKRYLVLHIGSGPATDHVDAAVRQYAENLLQPAQRK